MGNGEAGGGLGTEILTGWDCNGQFGPSQFGTFTENKITHPLTHEKTKKASILASSTMMLLKDGCALSSHMPILQSLDCSVAATYTFSPVLMLLPVCPPKVPQPCHLVQAVFLMGATYLTWQS